MKMRNLPLLLVVWLCLFALPLAAMPPLPGAGSPLESNHGRDNGSCPTPCEDCAKGMPVWFISRPYLNLWVRDIPVFYKTSLGTEVQFEVSHKQRDTRPADDGIYPATGWHHNWYSYVRFNIPVLATKNELDTNTTVIGHSPMGVDLRANWELSQDPSQWKAILYAPDNSESYFDPNQTVDRANSRSIVPILSSGTVAGFRVVHGDGSQDIYTVMGPLQDTYGIVEKNGLFYDKLDRTNGMKGLWRPELGRASGLYGEWQYADDVVIYSEEDSPAAQAAQQADVYNSEDPPPYTAVFHKSGDALLTKRVDPFGNGITLNYTNCQGRFYLAELVDDDGLSTHLGYDENGFLRTVEMPHNRSAHLVHDASGKLQSVTDAQGMTSQFRYVAKGMFDVRVSGIVTPYGTNAFEYYDESPIQLVLRPFEDPLPVYVGENNVNHYVIATHPDNSKEFYLWYGTTNTAQLSPSVAVSQNVNNAVATGILDDGTAGGEGSLQARNFFHWSRRQSVELSVPLTNMVLADLTSSDFQLATQEHYPVRETTAGRIVASRPSFVRQGSPNGVEPGTWTWHLYDNQSGAWTVAGDPAQISTITEAPDGTPLVRTTHFDDFGRVSSESEPYTLEDGSVGTRTSTWAYGSVLVEDEPFAWALPYLSSITTPAGVTSLNAPTLTHVNGVPTLNWPIVEVTDFLSQTSSYYFNSRHQLTGARLSSGLSLTNLYGPDGFLQKSIALEIHRTNSFSFEQGELASTTTPLGLTVHFTHDALGRLTGAGFPDGTYITNIYERLDLAHHKDRLDRWTHREFDSMGQLRTSLAPDNGLTQLGYCLCGGIDTITDPLLNTTTYHRDLLGRVESITSAQGTVTITRDRLGRPDTATSTWGLDLDYTYNYQGKLASLRNPAGQVFSVLYDDRDYPVQYTDAQGISITNEFDPFGRLTKQFNELGLALENEYGARGLNRTYDALRRFTDYVRDEAGRLTAITNANNEVIQAGYNPVGNLLRLTDGRNHTKYWAYNIYGQQIAETNANDVLVRTNGYDALGRLTEQWTAAKGLTSLRYHAPDGYLETIESATGKASYRFDQLGRLRMASNSVGVCQFAYTNFGAFASALLSEDGPFTDDLVSYGYTGPNLTEIKLGSWEQGIGLDDALRPEVITSPAGTFTYSFTGAGRAVAGIEKPGGKASLEYGDAGWLEQVGLTNSAGVALDFARYTRDPLGLITNVHRLNGVQAAYGYDAIGQLTRAQAFELSGAQRKNEDLGYGYDPSWNLAYRTNHTLVQAFTSDPANRLQNVVRTGTLTAAGSVEGPVTSIAVNTNAAEIYSDGTFATVDGVALRDGNNLFVTVGTNAAGQLVTSSIRSQVLPESVTLQYDLNGNLRSNGQKEFGHDDANQLVEVLVPGKWRSEFLYDALGRRRGTKEYSFQSGAWVRTNEVRYVYDRLLVLQERDESNVPKVTYTRGLDLSGTMQAAGGIGGLLARSEISNLQVPHAYYHADGNGNVTTLTDASGTMVARYLYDPFGRLLAQSGPLAEANHYRFSSKEQHVQSGLYYYGFRFYEPSLQRWLKEDPIRERGGINLFGFAANNPVAYVDLFGLDPAFSGSVGVFSDLTAEEMVDASRTVAPLVTSLVASMFPGVGELQDAEVLDDPNSTQVERLLASVSLALSAFSDGLTPNAGSIIRPVRRIICKEGAKERLPSLDSTGKVHGELPRPKDLRNYSREELQQLRDELKQSVQKRIEITDQMGRDKPHGQRQGAEQDLVKSIEKVLEDLE